MGYDVEKKFPEADPRHEPILYEEPIGYKRSRGNTKTGATHITLLPECTC